MLSLPLPCYWRGGRVGRRRSPAKGVWSESFIEGSNPSLSVVGPSFTKSIIKIT